MDRKPTVRPPEPAKPAEPRPRRKSRAGAGAPDAPLRWDNVRILSPLPPPRRPDDAVVH